MAPPSTLSGSVVLALSLGLLTACDRAAPPAPAAAAAPAEAASPSPMTGITPHVEDVPSSGPKGTGPAEGSTAIGGVVANQDGGGAKKGGAPAPTGGDGAASTAK